jgi:hypothetical protein
VDGGSGGAETIDPGLQQQLQALQRRGRRWLNGFFALAIASWALAGWITSSDAVSDWWLLLPALLLIGVGAVAMGAITGLASTYRRDILGPLYLQAFGGARHDPDGGLSSQALERAGLFPRIFGQQRLEQCDRLTLDHRGAPLVLCEAGVWIVTDRRSNKPDEQIFSGTLFEWQARLPLAEPVVLLCGDTRAQPMPPALRLDRLQQVQPGHPALDGCLRVLCNTPTQARTALPQPVVHALAGHVGQHPGRWRVVLDGQGIVGAIEGPRFSALLHPKAPLPDAQALRDQVARLRAVVALVAALTDARPLPPR